MKKIVANTLIALTVSVSTLAITSPAMARSSQKFTSTLQAPSTPVRINVTLGEDLAFRANNLSTNIRDKFNSRDRNNGFANNGYFGQKDLDKLAERMKARMATRLEKSGITVRDDAATVLNIVITDARPNRPTFEQMSKSVGLSMSSFGIGGAKFEGTLVTPSGEQGNVSYGWYENDIRFAQYGGTWTDAHRAIDRFARKTAKALR